jgi:hypothetical protein
VQAAQRRIPLYPFMFVLPNGKLFDAGPDQTTRTLDVNTGQWSTVGQSPVDGHSAVMYRPGKILKSGTWADPDFPGIQSTNRAAAIDMTDPSPAWREVAPMHHPRSYHTLTVLPDGTVLASGGATQTDGINPSNAVFSTEIWDPTTDTWTETASYQRPRLYHSSAILLPDGRVLLAGGGAFAPANNESNAEIFSPPYLFKGPQPTVTVAPTTLTYGQTFSITTPDASKIQKVSFVRVGSVTHNFDQDQRFQWLNMRAGQTAGTIEADAPIDANTAPPGYYHLFILDDKGVPSKGWTVKIGPSTSNDTTPPSAPGTPTATVADDDVTLNWGAASDDVGVAKYTVHRGTTAGFTANDTNKIATVTSGTSYTDSNVATGSYRYKVVAVDAAGNAGPASGEATATVAADSTPPATSITAPAPGATVSGTVNVTANASDNRSVASVQFKADGTNIGSADTTAPYSASWNTTSLSNGNHTLTAVATDGAGNTTTSTGVTVNVDNGSPPTVSITAPAVGATVSGNAVSITANAADDRGVASVQFKVDGANLGAADTSSPYSATWNALTATPGQHTLTAVATDTDGNTTTSSPVNVNVDNGSPPTVSITAPAAGATVSGSAVSITANAGDDRGVASVQFKVDGTDLGAADTTSPYSATWNTLTATNGSHNLSAVARDSDGNTTTSAVVAVNVSNASTGLVAAFGFEETTGTTATDSSGSGNAGTINGPTRSTTGKFGSALSFDGINDQVSVPDANTLDLTNAMTLEAWVRPSALSAWRTILMKEQTAGLVYGLYANGDTNRPSAHIYTNVERDVRGTAAVPVNAWTHVAATYDGAVLRFFINGTQVSTANIAGTILTSTGQLRIGGNSIWGEWFNGLIDEVRVYKRTLTAAEIQADMNAPVVP